MVQLTLSRVPAAQYFPPRLIGAVSAIIISTVSIEFLKLARDVQTELQQEGGMEFEIIERRGLFGYYICSISVAV